MIVARIAIFHAGDPLGFVPSGIDAFVRGILRWSPPELEYVWFGASSNLEARPLGRAISVPGIHRDAAFIPFVSVDPSGRQTRVPVTLRYILALFRHSRDELLRGCTILDFHRLEPILLFGRDSRPKNLVLHQDMAVIRQSNSDIRWRHAPRVYEALEKRSFLRADRVFCVRESAVSRYRAAWPDQAPKFTYIPTWVDTEVFGPSRSEGERLSCRARIRVELEIPPDSLLLNFVGRLDRQKNPQMLLEAFVRVHARLPRARLVLIGDGALRPRIEQWLREQALGRQVKLLGALPRERIAEFNRAADLFVMSSAYEGMPIALLEALACGLPAVCTDVGEIRRVLRDGENGLICAEQTPAALADSAIDAAARVDLMRGEPCTRAIRDYGPCAVLGNIYDHHREQAHARSLAG
jgi:glycosyltransferase involved in cell wall biosynthesis